VKRVSWPDEVQPPQLIEAGRAQTAGTEKAELQERSKAWSQSLDADGDQTAEI
jgi:hypothetical protein